MLKLGKPLLKQDELFTLHDVWVPKAVPERERNGTLDGAVSFLLKTQSWLSNGIIISAVTHWLGLS